MDAGLKIKIGADISEADVKLNKLGQTVTEAGNKLKQLPNASGQATFALTNLSRVAQDAPFGFIAIANNIDPLVSSFVQLRKEAGSGKGALQALSASLAGGGGLILAFGLVSTALTLFGDKLLKLVTSTGEAGAEIKKINETITQLKDNIISIPDIEIKAKGDTAREIAKVQALAAAITDSNVPYEQQKKALTELQKINKERFGDLTIESAKYGELSTAVQDYTKQLVAEAFIKGSQDQITQQANLIGQLNKRLEVEKSVRDEAKKSLDIAKQASQIGVGGTGGSFVNESTKFSNAQKQVLATTQEILNAYTSIGDLQKSINKNVILKLQYDGTGEEDAIKKIQELRKKIEDRETKLKVTTDPEGIRALQTEIQNFQQQILKLQGIETGRIGSNKEIAKSIKEQNDALFAQLGILSAFRTNLPNAISQVGTGPAEKPTEFFLKPKEIGGAFNTDKAKEEADSIREYYNILNQAQEDGQKSIQEGILNAFSGIGDAFGTALSKGGGIKNALASAAQSLLGIIGGILQEVGKQVIKASALVQLLQKALSGLFTNPALGITVGIALISLGAILKNIQLAKVPGFATGGIINKPTVGMIGDNGPEAVIPLSSLGSIISSAVTRGVNAAGSIGIASSRNEQLVAQVRGSDLAFVLARTNNTTSRLG